MTLPAPLEASWIDERLDAVHPSAFAREIGLSFPVEIPDEFDDWTDAKLRYPFTVGDDDISNSHQIVIQVADDFVTHLSNTFATIEGTCSTPSCGANLAYDPDDVREYTPALKGRRIRRVCPRCSEPFEPSARVAGVRSGWMADAGKEKPALAGGVTFRFALQIDCASAWPRGVERIFLRPELRALVESVFEQPFDDVGGLC